MLRSGGQTGSRAAATCSEGHPRAGDRLISPARSGAALQGGRRREKKEAAQSHRRLTPTPLSVILRRVEI
jgi:hypothetical protein